MYLQCLEMSGFKSFADRTRLEFHPGVTGIVGPNGCGKSNVVDAIRWVLGETSAKSLRGDEMADVIFNGTDTRKPLGMAEVLLTLADCESDLPVACHEVCVGRRVYRDGRSEYLLNGSPCRLRDIHDLFVNTGIGRACYSMMQQGKIDQLLSSRPEDRREVFEEAAGITRFKQQKKEALRKLEHTEGNLLRISDVLEEQQRQLASLQRQASKARRYAGLFRDLRLLDAHWSHHRYRELGRECDLAMVSLAEDRRELREVRHAIEALESSLSANRSSLAGIERQIRDSLQALSETAARIDSAEHQASFNEKRVGEREELITRCEAEIVVLQERIRQEEGRLSDTGKELDRRSGRLVCQEEKLTGVQAGLSRQRQKRQEQEKLLRENQQRLAGCESSAGALRAQIDALAAQGVSQRERREILNGQLEELERQQAGRGVDLEELGRLRLQALAAEEVEAAGLARLESSRKLLEEASRSAGAAWQDGVRQLASQQARLEMLSQLSAAGEGLENGTRHVLRGLDQPDRLRAAVQGTLVSFLNVEDEVVAALEAALGPAIQSVLVTDAPAAASILDSLRERKLGLASLALPEPGHEDGALTASPDGSLGWLVDRIEATGPGKAVLQRLLFGIALVPDLEAAFRLRQTHPGLSVATLTGDFLSSSGVITGGFRDLKAGSALRIQREVRKLRKQTGALEVGVAALEEQAREAEGQVLRGRAEIESQRDRLRAAQSRAAEREAQWRLAGRERDQTEARLLHLRSEIAAADRAWEASERQRTGLEEKLHLALAEREELACSLPGVEEGVRHIQRAEERIAEEAALLRTEVAVERQAADSLRQQLGPLQDRLRELQRSLQQRLAETKLHRQRIAETEAESAALREQSTEAQARRKALEEAHAALATRRESALRAVEELETGLASRRRIESQLTQQVAEMEVRIAQFELRMENLAGQISERYQLQLDDFVPDPPALLACIEAHRPGDGRAASKKDAPPLPRDAEPDWHLVDEILPEMRRKLESIGTVNLEVIAEFDEMETRYRLIRSQHEDLTKSREELLKIIAKINRTTRELFAGTFEQIAASFRTMFAELFGSGAQAGLVLMDEQDPLECGIDIIAKPPGKKLQSINLLSGGERSMTAVALLFAIYLVKPAPFCVLDEMDAPLDDANIERFCRVLDRFCSQSQFIIVTHSKRTMHRADVMYGISMEERGVSKTLSVRLAAAVANDG